jgi:hypothetical protein
MQSITRGLLRNSANNYRHTITSSSPFILSHQYAAPQTTLSSTLINTQVRNGAKGLPLGLKGRRGWTNVIERKKVHNHHLHTTTCVNDHHQSL